MTLHPTRRLLIWASVLCLLSACSPRHLIVQGIAQEMRAQGQAPEDDLVLAHEASAFYLKFSEALLRQVPENTELAESVAAGFTQYAYAFVSFEADRLETRDVHAAQALRQRAARLYLRARGHALAALELAHPGFRQALQSTQPADWPRLTPRETGLAYWGAASWAGVISLSKDDPDAVADFPLALRLADLAYASDAGFGQGALASLMGTLELARPGGSGARALQYFDQAIALAGPLSAAPSVAKAENIALAQGERAQFEALLQQAIAIHAAHPDLSNSVMRERAVWLLGNADDLFP